jgi:tRNA-dihydrouridine synthase B
VAQHYQEVLLEYGTHVGLRAARKHLGWYLEAAASAVGATARKELLASEDPAAVLTGIASIFGSGWRLAA